MTARMYTEQLNGEAAGEALSALCALAKTKAGREEINGLLGDRLALHRAAGFRTLGVLERVGEHHGTWRDTVTMERRRER